MNFILKYEEFTTLRALIKAIPYGGDALDFWLSKKSENEKNKARETGIEKLILLTNDINDKIKETSFIGKNLSVKSMPSFLLPKIVKKGEYSLSETQKAKSLEISSLLSSRKKPNDICGAVLNIPNWDDHPLYIEYVHLSYSDIKAVRKEKIIYILSGNAIMFSEERKSVLLHRRSNESDYFPNLLHSFGGGFIPPDEEKLSDSKINESVRREILEETGISANIPKDTPVIVIDEFDVQFLQIAFIGINITNTQLIDARYNWEGKMVEIQFDTLEEKMKNYNEWTPSGWLHVIFWLSMNCPNSISELRFKGKTGKQLADKLLNDLVEFENRQ